MPSKCPLTYICAKLMNPEYPQYSFSYNVKYSRFLLLIYWTYLVLMLVKRFCRCNSCHLVEPQLPSVTPTASLFGRFVNTVMLKAWVCITMWGQWTWSKLCCVILYHKIHNLRAWKHISVIALLPGQSTSCMNIEVVNAWHQFSLALIPLALAVGSNYLKKELLSAKLSVFA